MKYRHFSEIPVFQLAHVFVLDVYTITNAFPTKEKYALSAQLTRASVSVPSNIVEGVTRVSKKELIYFLSVSRSSLSEAEYQLYLARDLDYISSYDYDKINELVRKILIQLSAWIKALKNDI